MRNLPYLLATYSGLLSRRYQCLGHSTPLNLLFVTTKSMIAEAA